MAQLRAQLLVRLLLLLQPLELLLRPEVGLTHGLELGVVPSLDLEKFNAFFAVVAWGEERG